MSASFSSSFRVASSGTLKSFVGNPHSCITGYMAMSKAPSVIVLSSIPLCTRYPPSSDKVADLFTFNFAISLSSSPVESNASSLFISAIDASTAFFAFSPYAVTVIYVSIANTSCEDSFADFKSLFIPSCEAVVFSVASLPPEPQPVTANATVNNIAAAVFFFTLLPLNQIYIFINSYTFV